MPNSACSSVGHLPPPALHDVGDQQHVGAVGVELEPVGDVFAQHRGRERPERFAILDLEIERRLHRGRARIAEDRAGAERARSEFHAPLEPADRLAVGEALAARSISVVVARARSKRAPACSSRRCASRRRRRTGPR